MLGQQGCCSGAHELRWAQTWGRCMLPSLLQAASATGAAAHVMISSKPCTCTLTAPLGLLTYQPRLLCHDQISFQTLFVMAACTCAEDAS